MNENPFASPSDEELPETFRERKIKSVGTFQTKFFYNARLYWKSTLYGCLSLLTGLVIGLPMIVILATVLGDKRMPDILMISQFSGTILAVFAPIILMVGILPGYLSYKKLLHDPWLILSHEGARVMSNQFLWEEVKKIQLQGNVLIFYHKSDTKSTQAFDSYYLKESSLEQLIGSVEHYSGVAVQ
jgi:hypothetical protein